MLSVFSRRKNNDIPSKVRTTPASRSSSRVGSYASAKSSYSTPVKSSYTSYGSAYDVSGLRREAARATSVRDTGYDRGTSLHSSSYSRRSSYDTTPSYTSKSTAVESSGKLCCDKCDGKHATDSCPYFKKAREQHPDALRRKPVDIGGGGGNYVLRSARVVRQPGDGSCLFHSMAYGLGTVSASSLRREIAAFIERNEDLEIAGDPLRDWVKWDSGCSAQRYARRMSVSGWGGGIEMAACARLKGVNIHVYERGIAGFKRISCFDVPNGRKTVHVLYCGGVHYDALVPS